MDSGAEGIERKLMDTCNSGHAPPESWNWRVVAFQVQLTEGTNFRQDDECLVPGAHGGPLSGHRAAAPISGPRRLQGALFHASVETASCFRDGAAARVS